MQSAQIKSTTGLSCTPGPVTNCTAGVSPPALQISCTISARSLVHSPDPLLGGAETPHDSLTVQLFVVSACGNAACAVHVGQAPADAG